MTFTYLILQFKWKIKFRCSLCFLFSSDSSFWAGEWPVPQFPP